MRRQAGTPDLGRSSTWTIAGLGKREQRRVAELEARAGDAKQHELVSAAGDLLGSFLGGRRSARSVLSKVKGASSRRKQTSAAGQRLETALASVEAKTMELGDLEAKTMELGHIDVRDLALIWVLA